MGGQILLASSKEYIKEIGAAPGDQLSFHAFQNAVGVLFSKVYSKVMSNDWSLSAFSTNIQRTAINSNQVILIRVDRCMRSRMI